MNSRIKAILPWAVAPVLGGVTLATGVTMFGQVPTTAALQQLEAEASTLQDRIRRLEQAQPTPVTAMADELPTVRSLGEVAADLATMAAASAVAIATVDFATAEDGGAAGAVSGSATPAAPLPGGATAAAGPQSGSSATEQAVADHLDLALRASGEFDSLVRFLHRIETARKLTRIADVRMYPTADGVEAAITVQAMFFTGATRAVSTPAMPGAAAPTGGN